MIQQTNTSALQSGVRAYERTGPQGPDNTNRAKSSYEQPNNQPGQSSPDVVANFSAAGLEAARSLTQPAEIVAQERTEERVGESEAQESQAEQQKELRSQSEQQQVRVDLLA